MHKTWLTLMAALLAASTLKAQQTAQPVPDLDRILRSWEGAMKEVKSLSARLSRRTYDKSFDSTEEFVGTAKYMKPNLARLDLSKKNKPADYERYICTGTFFYVYARQEKKIRVYELPKNSKGQISDENLLSFMFGMKAAEAKRRYDLQMQPARPIDKWYYYVLIKPKTAADKKDFTKARLVLNRTTFMPRQLWFQQPTGNTVTWDFPTIKVGADLNGRSILRSEFNQPRLEKGWKFEKIRVDAPPRVARPSKH
jgi:TIGR03009 family protein